MSLPGTSARLNVYLSISIAFLPVRLRCDHHCQQVSAYPPFVGVPARRGDERSCLSKQWATHPVTPVPALAPCRPDLGLSFIGGLDSWAWLPPFIRPVSWSGGAACRQLHPAACCAHTQ